MRPARLFIVTITYADGTEAERKFWTKRAAQDFIDFDLCRSFFAIGCRLSSRVENIHELTIQDGRVVDFQ